jgi:hypothetical protein
MTDELNVLTEAIIGAALEVHRALGPGLLEHAYETCLCVELTTRGLSLEFNAGWLTEDGLKRIVNKLPE